MRTNEKEKLNRINRFAWNIQQMIEEAKEKNTEITGELLGDIRKQADCIKQELQYF